MATYHLRLKVHSRTAKIARPGEAKRSSIVARAAYRSGERLYDQALGRWFVYDKPDIYHTEIVTPAGVDLPPWITNRQTLWNMVERAEKRVDAQLAREVELSLPRELSRDQQIAVVRAFVKDEFVAKGMVADISIHEPDAADKQPQPHAHILLCLRRVDAAMPTGFAAKKERDWNEREDVARAVGQARKRFNNTGLEEDKAVLEKLEAQRQVNLWRAAWATYANAALDEAGSSARIDHRTLEAQGIMRAPQTSLGLARHMVETAYGYLRERVTHWVGIKKRAAIYEDVEQMRQRDPAKLTDFLLQLSDLAESFAAQFRKPTPPEVAHER